MLNASNEGRANLTFLVARTTERPSVPVSFKTLIEIFENNDYPEKFQKLFLGKTEMKIRGESCSECCCSPINDDDTKWKPYQRIKCGYCGDFFCSRQLFYKHANKVHRYYLT